MQPVDVGIGRVYKHIIRQAAAEYFTALVHEQLACGVDPAKIRLSSKIPALRDASVDWLAQAVRYFRLKEKHELCLKAWSNCRIGKDWDLSWETITSPEARAAFLAKDDAFQDEIKGRTVVSSTRSESATTNITAQAARTTTPVPKAKRSSRRARKARFEDDVETPLEVVETLSEIQGLQAIINGSASSRSTCSNRGIEGYQQSEIVSRARKQVKECIGKAKQHLPEGYHYGLRTRGIAALSYKEDSSDEELESQGSDGEDARNDLDDGEEGDSEESESSSGSEGENPDDGDWE